MPRPEQVSRAPVRLGDGRCSHFARSAAAVRTAFAPESSMCRSRNSMGSAPAAAAISSINDSPANVPAGPLGSRRCVVRNGDADT